MSSSIHTWEIGDRLINRRFNLQATIYSLENGVTLVLTNGSVTIARRSTLESLGWQMFQKATIK